MKLPRRNVLASIIAGLLSGVSVPAWPWAHGSRNVATFVGAVPAAYSMLWNNYFDTTAIQYFDNTNRTAWNTTIPSFPIDWGTGTASSTVSLNQVQAPGGSLTGNAWTENNLNTRHMIRAFPVSANQSTSTTRCAGFFKANTRTRIVAQIAVVENNLSAEYAASVGFDLAGGNVGYDVVTDAGWTISNYSMTALGSGWYLCLFDASTTKNLSTLYATFYLDAGTGTAARNISYAGNGSSGVYVSWANMLPTGAWPLSQTFLDDFTTSATLDLSNTRVAGFNWYLANSWSACGMTGFAFKNGAPTVAAGLSVANSVLTWTDLTNTITNYIYTAAPTIADPTQYVGRVFAAPALFEAKMSWGTDPATPPTWPAFWADAIEGLTGSVPFVELDFMEHFGTNQSSGTSSTIHTWTPTAGHSSINGGGRILSNIPGFNLHVMNSYATLWLGAVANNGAGLFMNFFNGIYVTGGAATWGVADPPATGDTQHMAVILAGGNTGSAPGWPTSFDYVKVYQ